MTDSLIQQLTGRTMTDHIVVFDAPDRLVGQTVQVDIEDASSFTLFGRVKTGTFDMVELSSREPLPSAVNKRIGLSVV